MPSTIISNSPSPRNMTDSLSKPESRLSQTDPTFSHVLHINSTLSCGQPDTELDKNEITS